MTRSVARGGHCGICGSNIYESRNYRIYHSQDQVSLRSQDHDCSLMMGPDGFNVGRETIWTCPYGSYFDIAKEVCIFEDQPEKEDNCHGALGNPITATRGMKVQTELDSVDPAGNLSVRRVYRSLAARGDSQLALPPAQRAGSALGIGWSLELVPLIEWPGSSQVVAFVRRRDGGVMLFSLSGAGWTTDADVNYSLESVAGSGDGAALQLRNHDLALIERYSADGRILSANRANGRWEKYGYDSQSRLATITDQFGRALGLSYAADGYVDGITLNDHSAIAYTHQDGNLTQATYADAKSRTYYYAEPGLVDVALPYALTGIGDENGSRYASFHYDSQAQANRTEHAGGVNAYALAFGYGDATGSTNVTDPSGATRTYGYTTILGVRRITSQSQNSGSGCGESGSSITYDASGNVASRTDFDGHKTCYANDSRNLESKRVEGLSPSADCASALSAPPAPTTAFPARVISTQWHPDWRLESRRAEPKKFTTWVYNGQTDPVGGGTLTCAPGSALLPDGKPIAVLCKRVEQATTDVTGASGFSATITGSPRTWSWTYNSFGQVLTANGPRTDVTDTTTYTYCTDTAADHTLGDLYTVTDALGHVTTYTSYDKNGRPLTIVDPNGLTTTLTYFPRGWLKSRQVGSELTTYDYDGVGQLKKVTAPDTSWIGYDYDPAHRLTDIYDNLGNRITYTLDNAGNRTGEEVKDPGGNLMRTQSREYDALSRLKNIIQPE